MTNISRRTLAKGAAWSVPAIAVASTTSAVAASNGGPIDDCTGNNGCEAPFWPADGSMTYSVTGGTNGTDTTIAVNWGANGPGTVGGSVSALFNDGAGQANVPAAWITLADGSMRQGYATLGGTASWVVPSGVNSSTSFIFNDTLGFMNEAGKPTDLLAGATIHAPFTFAWTDETGKLRQCTAMANFTLPSKGYTAGITQLAVPPTFTAVPNCVTGCPSRISSITPGTGQTVGSIVTLNGAGLAGVVSATYGGVPVTDLTVVNDNTVTFRVPATPGTGGSIVYVETVTADKCKANTSATKTNQCVTDATDATGANYKKAGATATIKGVNFTGATGATYNGVPVTNFTVVDDKTITYTVPTAPGVWGTLYPLVIQGQYCTDEIGVAHG